jgi:uncharacterized iron-regulated protein
MIAVLVLQALLTAQAPAPASYVPQRVYETRHQSFSDFEAMVADVSRADVVLVGEQHDDANTHRLEVAVLEGLRRRGVTPAVSMEMFERDVQSTVDAYLAGTIPEADFLQKSRPWPRYATDYRAIVELAKSESWPVTAANVPRRLAGDVAKSGLSAIDALPASDRALAASELQCAATGPYFDRFVESMSDHSSTEGGKKPSADERRASNERYFAAQCLKDETMAESIAAAADRGRRPVVHFDGSFHSDFFQGTAERVQRRLPQRRVVVVSILPVKDLDAVAPTADDLKRADYLVYTVAGK